MKILSTTLWCILGGAIACLSAIVIYVGFATAPIFWDSLPSQKVDVACKRVRSGMTFDQFDQTLHENTNYLAEFADFDRNRYTYIGRDGSCRVDLDAGTNQVAS